MTWQRLLRAAGIVIVACSALAVAVGMAVGIAEFLVENFVLQTATFGIALGVVVAASARTQGHNPAVRLLALFAAIMAIEVTGYVVVGAYVDTTLGSVAYERLISGVLAPRDLPLGLAIVMWFPLWTWIVSLGGFLTFGLLLFPDGHLPTPRWRPVAAAAGVAIATIVVGYMGLGWPTSGVGITGMETVGWAGALVTAGFPLFGLTVLASFASLFLRYRGASSEVRHQLRWVMFGVGSMAVGFPLLVIPQVLGVWGVEVVNVGSMLLTPLVVAGYGVAVVKYRLYDVNVVISKALVVAGLGGLITAVYVGVVVGLGRLLGAGDGPDMALSIVATAMVAVAFQPARERLAHWANRLVYGERATPYEVLSRFSRSTAARGEEALDELAHLVAEATGSEVRFEVASGETFTTVASSGTGSGVPDPSENAEHEQLVHHEGELLGRISLTTRRGEGLTDQDADLVRQLGSGLAVLLRNQRLTAELRVTIEEREASRQRLLDSTDEARLLIERSLREGPEQALTGLKLGLQRAVGGSGDAAPRTTQVLTQLVDDADHAIATIRTLASGAYPALLAAEGLEAALSARAAAAPVPVSLQAPGLGRLERGIETAIYFCVLESLQNATKYAGGRSVQIGIHEHDGAIVFEVRDDGDGFDPGTVARGAGLTNMQDRLDTVGGTLTIDSAPGAGTVVRGSIPLTGAGVEPPDLTAAGPSPTPTRG